MALVYKLPLQQKALLMAFGLTILSAILVLLASGLFDTSNWRGATCLPTCFGEAVNAGDIKQPVATFSSLAYLFVGVFALFYPKSTTKTNLNFSNRLVRSLFGWSLIIAGLGSAFLHMTLSFIGQTVDVVGMYLLATFVILYAYRTNWQNSKQFLLAYIVFNVALFLVLIFAPELRRYLFAILLVIGLIAEFLKNRKNTSMKLLFYAATTMAVGFGIWLVDQLQLFSAPWFYGHTVWHIMGAVAGYLLFHHYLSPNSA